MDEMDDKHVILPRPYISAVVNGDGDIVITVIGVSQDNQRVENDTIVVPWECAEELGQAMIRLVTKK